MLKHLFQFKSKLGLTEFIYFMNVLSRQFQSIEHSSGNSVSVLKIDFSFNSVTNNFQCRKYNLSKVNWDITKLNLNFTQSFTIRVVGSNLNVF